MNDAAGSAPVTVVVVDEHEIVAEGLAALLDRSDDIDIVGTADESSFLEVVQRSDPDVVVLDSRLRRMTGAQVADEMHERGGRAQIVMLTNAGDRRGLARALDAGCVGFVSKTAATSDLVAAVRAAAKGDSYVSHDMMQQIIQLRRTASSADSELSDRECQMLQRTADGLLPDEIAAELDLSPHTVKNHLRHAMSKLGANTKLDAVISALRDRQITLSD